MSESLKEKTATGLFWGAMNSGTTQVLNLVFGIVLGRLLSPADYGIVGVLTVFTVIAGNLQSSGFTQGLINLKHPTRNDYNSVFWFNVLVSLTVYAVLFFCAPLIAKFFHEPRLTTLSRFVFLTFLISSLGITSNAYMTKNMMNRELMVCGGVALLGSGTVGTVLAFNGFAYWSLAWQQVVYITLLNLCRFYYTPRIANLHIDFGPVRRMFRFGMRLLVTNIINTLSQNVLTFIFGRLYPMHAVGNFSQANKWNTMADSFVANTVGQIAQPVMVSVKEEPGREKLVFRKMMRFTAFLSFPAMFGLALVANEFILLTIGPKWTGSVILLQMLCVGGAFVPFYTLYQNLAISRGRSDIYMWCNVGQIALQILIIVVLHSFGINVMVAAYSLFLILWLAVWQYIAYRMVGVTVLETLKDLGPFCLAAFMTMAVTYGLTSFLHGHALLFLSRVVIASVVYFIVMKLSHAVILEECLAFAKAKLKRK